MKFCVVFVFAITQWAVVFALVKFMYNKKLVHLTSERAGVWVDENLIKFLRQFCGKYFFDGRVGGELGTPLPPPHLPFSSTLPSPFFAFTYKVGGYHSIFLISRFNLPFSTQLRGTGSLKTDLFSPSLLNGGAISGSPLLELFQNCSKIDPKIIVMKWNILDSSLSKSFIMFDISI